MPDTYEGRVSRQRVAPGSKSDREAVILESGEERLILRRQGGNAFTDRVLDDLVGRRIRGTGRRTGNTLILSRWEDLG